METFEFVLLWINIVAKLCLLGVLIAVIRLLRDMDRELESNFKKEFGVSMKEHKRLNKLRANKVSDPVNDSFYREF